MLQRGGIELLNYVDRFSLRYKLVTLYYFSTLCVQYDENVVNFLRFIFLCCLLQYTPAIDIWSIGCIFAELLTGKPLFPGKNVVHQLDLMTDLLGTPPPETIARVRHN